MDADRLRNALVTLIRRWQRAALSGSVEALQPVRATFREMMAAQRTALHELAGDADQNTRAMATFCVAFGDQPADLTVVTRACADASERVRIWAAYGLAERRDPNTDLDVLLKLLGDAHPKVRVRACQATRACVPIDSPRRGEFARRLLRMVAGDPDDLVHPPAAQALDALATEEELTALIEAEAQEEVPSARWQLEATIRRLGGKPKSASDN
jgi:HEAT repeat protein